MSRKFKDFSDLSNRQKRRRLDKNFENCQIEQALEDSVSSEDEHQNEEVIDAMREQLPINNDDAFSNGDDDVHNNDFNICNDIPNDDNGDSSDDSDNNASESSHEDLSDWSIEDAEIPEIPVRVENEADVSESSVSEDEDAGDFRENAAYLQKKALKNAFLAANINQSQGNTLLRTLREFPFQLNSLPKDSRTVFNTPTVVASTKVRNTAGGQYLHVGLKKTLIKKLESIPINLLPHTVEIDFSTDGAKVDKGLDQMWPIQYRIFNIPDKRPIIVGIFQGRHKPSNPFDFFEEFVQELLEIQEQGGIMIRNRFIAVILRCFIADAPARAFILNHFGHNSTNPCSKCKVEGRRCINLGFEGTMVFLGVEHEFRTDEQYKNLLDEDHQKGRSPLGPLIPLVTRVPFEIMHSVYIGNVKKIFSAQVDGKFGFRRLNGRKIDILDLRMRELHLFCPSEFNRRPQDFSKFHSFKATEFRQFLLYTSPGVVKNVFEEDYYKHLMILHSVMRLLVSEETPREMFDYCREALKMYVELSEELYREQFLSYNLHSTLHFVEDVEVLGPAETFSAFCYENNLQQLRKLIRKPGLKLQQIYKRLCERDDFVSTPVGDNIEIRVSQIHAEGPLPDNITADNCQQFRKLEVGKFTFSIALRDSCCFLKNSEICIIKNIIRIGEEIRLIVQQFRSISDMYDVGIASTSVLVFNCENLEQTLRSVLLTDVKNKMYIMPQWSDVEGEEELVIPNKWTCTSLLSTFNLPNNTNI